jgi:uncharacterized protein DUF2059
MTVRAWAGMALLAVWLGMSGQAMAQEDDRRTLARDLAHLMLDDNLRRELNEQVAVGLTTALGSTLQTRLNRRLQDMEWRLVSEIVGRFVTDTLVPSRTDDLAADVYARRFDEAELRELLAFQRSAVGRKAARLTPLIAIETAQAINDEIRSSPALPRMVEELERAFPVLRIPESP